LLTPIKKSRTLALSFIDPPTGCGGTDDSSQTPFSGLFFQDNLGKSAPERLNQSGF